MEEAMMNDDLVDLLGKLYRELDLAQVLQITFAEFIADYERHLSTAAMHRIGRELSAEIVPRNAGEQERTGALLDLLRDACPKKT